MWPIIRQIAHEPLTTRLYSSALACSLAFWVGAYGAYGIVITVEKLKSLDESMISSGNAYANSTIKLSKIQAVFDTSLSVPSIKKIDSGNSN